MILLRSEDIKNALKECKPNRIAVAYVGNDWNEYIEPSIIDEIIISPTIGSNPYAIEEMANKLSWEKIYFLDNLHAKFYIGESVAILGSSNLSKNGIDVNGLQEASVEIYDKELIKELNTYFNELKEKAKEGYSVGGKKKKVSELKTKWNQAVRQSFIKRSFASQNVDLSEYEPLHHDDFYIVWYKPGNYEYTGDVKHIKHLIDEDMHFADKDEVKTGKWILVWRLTNSNTPHKNEKPCWIYIDEIFDNAVETNADEEYLYKKLAIFRADRPEKPPVPFELNKEVIDSFRHTLMQEKFKSFIGDTKPFYVRDTFPVFKKFISEMKQYYNRIRA